MQILEEARVPSGPIYNVEDMLGDEHFQQRGLFEQVEINGEALKIPAILPKLKRTPGQTRWPGPDLGSHNEEIFGGLLGLDDDTLENLRNEAVI